MRVAQVTAARGPIEIVDRPMLDPGPGKVRVKVEACGLCHSDLLTKEGVWPGLTYPRVPGHEVTGVVDALGEGVINWTKGQRVGIGWIGGHCTVCQPCRRGKFAACEKAQIPGIVYDGGYQEYMITSAQGLAAIPDAISFTEAAPLLCAGITTFNALRHSGAMPGDLVAIQGLGGLGHLGIQYANKMGFETVAIGRGEDKKEFATKLGAHHYIDTNAVNAAEALQKLGGATTILATAPDSKSMTPLVTGLGGGPWTQKHELSVRGLWFRSNAISSRGPQHLFVPMPSCAANGKLGMPRISSANFKRHRQKFARALFLKFL